MPITRVCIIGAVGSGKTTLARELSTLAGLPFHELDSIVYEMGPGNTKRPPDERDCEFNNIIDREKWVIEGVYREYFNAAFDKADCIIVLDTPVLERNLRILKRWILQLRGIEKANYEPTIGMLFRLLKWSNRFHTILVDIRKQLDPYADKVITIRDNDAGRLVEELYRDVRIPSQG